MSFDLEQFRLREGDCPVPKPKPRKTKKSAGPEKFIKGPIPVTWLVKAAELRGQYTLRTALALFYVQGLTGRKRMLLERYHFDQFQIGKDSARRALQRLEQAGLIKLGKKGRKLEVMIIL